MITQTCENIKSVFLEPFHWDHQSILLLLDEYRKRMSKFRNPKFKKKILWQEIEDIMKQKGYDVVADVIDKKMRNMKNTFKTIVDNNNKKKSTGRGRLEWPYFKIFEDIFKQDKTVNISCVMSSTRGSNKNKLSEINSISELPHRSPQQGILNINTENIDIENPSSGDSELLPKYLSTDATPKRGVKRRQLDICRKRQLEMEEEKLIELKKVREAIEKSNEIQERRLKVLENLVENKSIL